jgi:hypothetical protein
LSENTKVVRIALHGGKNLENPKQAVVELIGAYEGRFGGGSAGGAALVARLDASAAFIVPEGHSPFGEVQQQAFGGCRGEMSAHRGLNGFSRNLALDAQDPY